MAIEYLTDKKCRLVVYNGKTRDGKQRRSIKTVTYKSKRDAQRQYNEFEREVRESEVSSGSAATVKQIVTASIRSAEKKKLQPTTVLGYKVSADRLPEWLTKMQAKKVTAYDVDLVINELIDEGYSPKTIKNTMSILNTAYKKAKKWKWVSDNPCEDMELPAAEKKEKDVLKLGEVPEFCEALADEPLDFQVAVELALFCGLRRSEICGLTKENIDLDKKVISIEKTRHRIEKVTYTAPPKTETSRRTLALPDSVAGHIRILLDEHAALAKRLDVPESSYLILNGFGEPVPVTFLTQHIAVFEKNHDLPRISFHELRHTYTSMLNFYGHDIAVISKQLGHSNTAITLNTYTHMFEDASAASRGVAGDMDRIMRGGKTHFPHTSEN